MRLCGIASSKLSSTAFKTMQSTLQAGKPIYVSSVSMVEIAYLTEKGRLPKELFERIAQLLRQENQLFVEMPFNLGMAETLRKIPASIVPDMPDRMIAATALHLNLPLITCDQKIRAAPLVTIW